MLWPQYQISIMDLVCKVSIGDMTHVYYWKHLKICYNIASYLLRGVKIKKSNFKIGAFGRLVS